MNVETQAQIVKILLLDAEEKDTPEAWERFEKAFNSYMRKECPHCNGTGKLDG